MTDNKLKIHISKDLTHYTSDIQFYALVTEEDEKLKKDHKDNRHIILLSKKYSFKITEVLSDDHLVKLNWIAVIKSSTILEASSHWRMDCRKRR